MVKELLAARGIIVSHETVRQWARKIGQRFANQISGGLGRNHGGGNMPPQVCMAAFVCIK